MDFYYNYHASASRAVLMTAKTLGVELNKISPNLSVGEQLKPEFLKLNPQHTVPTLVDNGFSVWESRAILIYLAEKYGKEDSLYPSDPQQKALVNQRLYFDMGTLQKSFGDYYYPQIRRNEPANPENYKKIEVAFGFLNTFLEDQLYVTGNKLTIADISILANVSTFVALDFKLDNYPNVAKWYANAQKVVPGWEENWEGIMQAKAWFIAKVSQK